MTVRDLKLVIAIGEESNEVKRFYNLFENLTVKDFNRLTLYIIKGESIMHYNKTKKTFDISKIFGEYIEKTFYMNTEEVKDIIRYVMLNQYNLIDISTIYYTKNLTVFFSNDIL